MSLSIIVNSAPSEELILYNEFKVLNKDESLAFKDSVKTLYSDRCYQSVQDIKDGRARIFIEYCLYN